MKYSVKYILNWFPGLSWCLTPCSLEEKQRFCKGPGGVISQPATWHRNKMLSSRSTMSPGDDFPCSVLVKSARVQFSSVTHLCPTLCDPMNHSTPGLPVPHQLLEFTQTHVHRVSDAIQPSHPPSSPSPSAPNLSQHQSLFQWVNS